MDFRHHTQLIRVPKELTETQVGKIVHVWGLRACYQYRLLRFTEEWAFLETPKTHKPKTIKRTDVCYSRANEPKVERVSERAEQQEDMF